MRGHIGFMAGASMLLLAGCASYSPEAGWVEPGPSTAHLPVGRPPEATGDARAESPALAGGVLELDQALKLAFEHNAELQAMGRRVRSLEHRRLQAARWSNPSIDVAAEDLVGSGDFSGVDQVQLTAEVGQELDLAGKHAARATVQARMRDEAGWAYELARLSLLRRTAMAYTDVLLAQLRLVNIGEEVRLAEEVLLVLQTQADAGRAAGMEVERAQIAVALAKIDLQSGRLQLETARQSLAACWGGLSADFSAVRQDLEDEPAAPPEDALLSAVDAHPRMRILQLRQQAQRARVEAARAEGMPDLRLYLGYRYLHGPGDSAMVAGVSLPLPLVDRNQDAVAAARQELAAAEDRLRAERAKRVELIVGVARRLQAARQAAGLLDEEVLPRSRKTFEAVKEGVRIGRFGTLDLLDAQRTLFKVRRQTLEARVEAHRARLDLEFYLARPLGASAEKQPEESP